MVVMLVFAGHATASWESCYGPCFLKCMVNSKKLFSCAFKCLKQCVFRPASNPLYYCSLGCSMNECAELSNGISLSPSPSLCLSLSLSLFPSLSLSLSLSPSLSLSLSPSLSLSLIYLSMFMCDLSCRFRENGKLCGELHFQYMQPQTLMRFMHMRREGHEYAS